MFDENSFDFDTPHDVIVCMNNEFILQNFAINLIDVNDKIYKKSEVYIPINLISITKTFDQFQKIIDLVLYLIKLNPNNIFI